MRKARATPGAGPVAFRTGVAQRALRVASTRFTTRRING